MAFWNRRAAEEIEKAPKASFPAGSARDASALVSALTRAMGDLGRNGDGRPLPRPAEWQQAIFGPDWPLSPEILDGPRPDTGLPDPRLYQYPVSWNLQYFDDRPVDWETLRRASETPLFRACIEIRKTEMQELDWIIRVSPTAAEAIARKSRRSKEDVTNELRTRYEADIERLTGFWEIPDRKNGHDFQEWIALLMEEELVLDAVALYPHRTIGGDVHGFWVLDGATIKPLLDQSGGRPVPPAPAYQQILYGFPRGEFTADTVSIDDKVVVPNGLTASELIYKRRVVRRRSPYGFSPVEQALLDGLLYSKRFQWMLAEYTEGSQPAQFLLTKEANDWSAREILQYERMLNDRFAGKTGERQRYPLLPFGIEPAAMAGIPERYKADYDLHLIARVAMHFLITLPELGFTEKGGLGSAGYHEGQEAIQYRRGRLPDLRWHQRFLTSVSRSQLAMPKALEFAFLGLEEEDEATTDQVTQNRVASARMTLNEARARDGLPPYNFPEADMPMLETARGVVFIQGAAATAPAGVMIEPASEHLDVPGQPGSPGAPTSPTQRRPIASAGGGQGAPASAAKPGKAENKDAAQTEIAAYRRWAAKHAAPSRLFRFEYVSEDDAAELAPELLSDDRAILAKAAAGGGAGPKAGSHNPYSRQPGQAGS